MCILSNRGIVKHVIKAPIIPTIIDSQALKRKQPPNWYYKVISRIINILWILIILYWNSPVIATNEPRMPFIWLKMSILSGPFRLKPKPTKPPPMLANIVEIAALAAYCHRCPLTPYVLPLLKANQPHLV